VRDNTYQEAYAVLTFKEARHRGGLREKYISLFLDQKSSPIFNYDLDQRFER